MRTAASRQLTEVRKRWRMLKRRELRMNVTQCLPLNLIHGKGVYDAFPRRADAIDRPNRECRDVVLEPTAAAGSALRMAGDTRSGIEHRAESVSTLGKRVVRLPLMHEEQFYKCHAGYTAYAGFALVDRTQGAGRRPLTEQRNHRQADTAWESPSKLELRFGLGCPALSRQQPRDATYFLKAYPMLARRASEALSLPLLARRANILTYS